MQVLEAGLKGTKILLIKGLRNTVSLTEIIPVQAP